MANAFSGYYRIRDVRRIQTVVPNDRLDAVESLLEEEGIDYVRHRGWYNGEESWVVEFPVPTDAIGYVLSRLEEVGIDTERYTTITSLESAMTPASETLENRFADDFDPLTRPELRSKAQDMSRDTTSFLGMTLLSALIAVAGLLGRSPAVVVGSMVIAPLVGPVLTTAVGWVTGDRAMLLNSIWLQFGGIAIALVGALALSAVLRLSGFYPPVLDVTGIELIALRGAPSLFTIVVGIASGVAVVFGLTTKGPTSLIGVMIAAALVPSAATTGIAVAWQEYRIALGSLVVLLVTILLINASAVVTAWQFGYRPESDDWFLTPEADRALIGLTVLVVAVGAVAVGVVATDQIASQQTVSGEIAATLGEAPYDHLSLVGVQVEYGTHGVGAPEHVAVVVSSPAPASATPNLSADLERRLTAATGSNLTVTVTYRTYQDSAAGSAVPNRSSEPRPTYRRVFRSTSGPMATVRRAMTAIRRT